MIDKKIIEDLMNEFFLQQKTLETDSLQKRLLDFLYNDFSKTLNNFQDFVTLKYDREGRAHEISKNLFDVLLPELIRCLEVVQTNGVKFVCYDLLRLAEGKNE